MKCLLIKGKVVKAAVKKSDSEIKAEFSKILKYLDDNYVTKFDYSKENNTISLHESKRLNFNIVFNTNPSYKKGIGYYISGGSVDKELFYKNYRDVISYIKMNVIKDKFFADSSSSKKVTAFYDFFEMEPKLTKLQNNIQYFLDTINKTLKKLDSIKALYQTESDLDGNKAEFLTTVTNKKNEDKTFSISLEGNFVRTKVLLREKVNNGYKQLRYPLFTEIDKFLGEL